MRFFILIMLSLLAIGCEKTIYEVRSVPDSRPLTDQAPASIDQSL